MTERMKKRIRLLIADHHPRVREGLRALIQTERDMEWVGDATDGIQVIERARALQPDVILLDLVLPRQDSLNAIRRIKENDPQVCILALCNFADDERTSAALRLGASGTLLKDSSPNKLLEAIRALCRQRQALPRRRRHPK